MLPPPSILEWELKNLEGWLEPKWFGQPPFPTLVHRHFVQQKMFHFLSRQAQHSTTQFIQHILFKSLVEVELFHLSSTLACCLLCALREGGAFQARDLRVVHGEAEDGAAKEPATPRVP